MCQGFLIVEASRSHSDTPNSVGILLTGDQPEEEDSNRQYTLLSRDTTSVSPAGFEPAIPASERLQTYALDCAATGIGHGC